MSPVAVDGSGPTRETIETILREADVAVLDEDADWGEASVAVAVGDPHGSEPPSSGEAAPAERRRARFKRVANDAADADIPWLAVEIGTLGGDPGPDGAVTGLAVDGPCYNCLLGRVAANANDDETADGMDDEDSVDDSPGGESSTQASSPTSTQASSQSPPSVPPGTRQEIGAVAARAAIAIDAGDRSPVGRIVERPHAERDLLPVPGCPCGGERVLGIGEDVLTDTDRPLEATVAAAERAVEDRVGLVAQVGELDSYPAPYYLAELARTEAFSEGSAPRQAAGVDRDWQPAYMRAVGEAFERYAAAIYSSNTTFSSPPEQILPGIRPSAFVRPDDWSTDPSTPIRWVEATHLAEADDGSERDSADGGGSESDPADHDGGGHASVADVGLPAHGGGEGTHVPADVVLHPPPARNVRPPTTTGLGLHSSLPRALVAGLTEVIERDATMLAWYSTFEPLGLDVGSDGYRTLASRVRSDGYDVTALLVTQDVDVPVVVVALERDSFPAIAFGSAAALDPNAAAERALAEAVQNAGELERLGPDGTEEIAGAIRRYASAPGAAARFADPDQTIPADTVGPANPPTGAAALDELIERASAAGLTPLASRLTTRDLYDMDFEAVRVLAPEAQPLFLGDPYFGERARTVPPELGFEPLPEKSFHPFP